MVRAGFRAVGYLILIQKLLSSQSRPWFWPLGLAEMAQVAQVVFPRAKCPIYLKPGLQPFKPLASRCVSALPSEDPL